MSAEGVRSGVRGRTDPHALGLGLVRTARRLSLQTSEHALRRMPTEHSRPKQKSRSLVSGILSHPSHAVRIGEARRLPTNGEQPRLVRKPRNFRTLEPWAEGILEGTTVSTSHAGAYKVHVAPCVGQVHVHMAGVPAARALL